MVEKLKRAGIRIKNCLKRHYYHFLYLIILGVLWLYIGLNWEKCVSMQFFSQFDGNNILFLVGILLVILPFYEVEGKGFKIHRAGEKELENDLGKAESEYQKTQIQKIIVMQSQGVLCQTEVTENE